MSRYLVDRIEQHGSIHVLTRSTVSEARGDDWLSQVVISAPAGEAELDIEGLFILIGADPLTKPVSDWLRCDSRGFILAGADLLEASDRSGWPLERDPLSLETSHPGVFVAGDVRHRSVKRVASAVGDGALAVALIHSLRQD